MTSSDGFAAQSPPPDLPHENLVTTVHDLVERVAAGEEATSARFETMRTAFVELRSELRSGSMASRPDDPRRRLVVFLGYEPTAQQQVELFQALAAWHATKPRLVPNCTAEYRTKKGALVSYNYADLAEVIATGQTAVEMGLVVLTCQEFDDNGHAIVTGYLLHSGGGAIGSGPVPLYVGESDRPGQAHAAGLTTCRRLALQMVLGLAAERDDDFNATEETASRREASKGNEPRSLAPPPRRQPPVPPAGAPQGRPPGWLSREERQSLESELQSASITPDRLQEIEQKLQAASRSATRPAAGGAPS